MRAPQHADPMQGILAEAGVEPAGCAAGCPGSPLLAAPAWMARPGRGASYCPAALGCPVGLARSRRLRAAAYAAATSGPPSWASGSPCTLLQCTYKGFFAVKVIFKLVQPPHQQKCAPLVDSAMSMARTPWQKQPAREAHEMAGLQ